MRAKQAKANYASTGACSLFHGGKPVPITAKGVFSDEELPSFLDYVCKLIADILGDVYYPHGDTSFGDAVNKNTVPISARDPSGAGVYDQFQVNTDDSDLIGGGADEMSDAVTDIGTPEDLTNDELVDSGFIREPDKAIELIDLTRTLPPTSEEAAAAFVARAAAERAASASKDRLDHNSASSSGGAAAASAPLLPSRLDHRMTKEELQRLSAGGMKHLVYGPLYSFSSGQSLGVIGSSVIPHRGS